jgi:hypothetical protein
MVRTGAFPRGEYWTGLIFALEDSLRLHCHQPGALTGLEECLHRRAGGMIGSLLRLIHGAAIQAVLDGTEKITRTALDSVGADIASETAGACRRRPGAPRNLATAKGSFAAMTATARSARWQQRRRRQRDSQPPSSGSWLISHCAMLEPPVATECAMTRRQCLHRCAAGHWHCAGCQRAHVGTFPA